MKPFVKFNGISSLDLNLRLVSAEVFIIPTRTRSREYIPGRIGSISREAFEYPSLGVNIRLAYSGHDKPDVVSWLHGVSSWALSAHTMELWHSDGYYYTGSVEDQSEFNMLTRRTGQIEIRFMCDPPCRQKAKMSTKFIPLPTIPVPEQISPIINTVSAENKTSAFSLSVGPINSPVNPALYFHVNGSFTTLNIGNLKIIEALSSGSIYIDAEQQEVYKLIGGIRTPIKYEGDFPVLNTAGSVGVTGVDMNVTIRTLVIERG